MKSFLWSPPIVCVHQSTVTRPYSVIISGWWSSSSAIALTLLVNYKACAKFLNLKTRSSLWIPSTSLTIQLGIWECILYISSCETVCSSARQATHFISRNSVTAKPQSINRYTRFYSHLAKLYSDVPEFIRERSQLIRSGKNRQSHRKARGCLDTTLCKLDNAIGAETREIPSYI